MALKRKFHLLSHLLETSPALFTVLTFTAHVLLAPYTKVEESFNLHAVHDVLVWGIRAEGVARFDHHTFPQPVYRSYLPSLVLAGLSWPVCYIGRLLGLVHATLHVQISIRLTLAWITALSHFILASSIRRRTRSLVERNLFLLLSITQFHVPFWGSRTIPNSLALPLVCYALSLLIHPINAPTSIISTSTRKSILILTATTAIVRSELATFLLPLTLILIYLGRITLLSALLSGAVGGFGGLAATLLVDRWFYGVWVWSEMQAVVFNVLQGKSAEWGVMPWHHYFTNSLPKLLLCTLLLLVYTFVDPNARTRTAGLKRLLLVPSLGMLGIMSCVGHKEWRFVMYVVPCFNVLAALGAGHIWRTRHLKSLWVKFRLLALLGGLIANVAITGVLTSISMKNYPGGRALEFVHVHALARGVKRTTDGYPAEQVKVFLPPAALMQGASLLTFSESSEARRLFARLEAPFGPSGASNGTATGLMYQGDWHIFYDRTEALEDLTSDEMWKEGYSYIITDRDEVWDRACDARADGGSASAQRWRIGEEEYVPRGITLQGKRPSLRWEKALTVYVRIDQT